MVNWFFRRAHSHSSLQSPSFNSQSTLLKTLAQSISNLSSFALFYVYEPKSVQLVFEEHSHSHSTLIMLYLMQFSSLLILLSLLFRSVLICQSFCTIQIRDVALSNIMNLCPTSSLRLSERITEIRIRSAT